MIPKTCSGSGGVNVCSIRENPYDGLVGSKVHPYDGMNLIREDPYDGLELFKENPYDGNDLMIPKTCSSSGGVSVCSISKDNNNNNRGIFKNKVGNNNNSNNNIKKIFTHHMKPTSKYNEHGTGEMYHGNMNGGKWSHAQDMRREELQMVGEYFFNII